MKQKPQPQPQPQPEMLRDVKHEAVTQAMGMACMFASDTPGQVDANIIIQLNGKNYSMSLHLAESFIQELYETISALKVGIVVAEASIDGLKKLGGKPPSKKAANDVAQQCMGTIMKGLPVVNGRIEFEKSISVDVRNYTKTEAEAETENDETHKGN